ncbi:unnamed protein product [Coccothraustes coccothraustes]
MAPPRDVMAPPRDAMAPPRGCDGTAPGHDVTAAVPFRGARSGRGSGCCERGPSQVVFVGKRGAKRSAEPKMFRFYNRQYQEQSRNH